MYAFNPKKYLGHLFEQLNKYILYMHDELWHILNIFNSYPKKTIITDIGTNIELLNEYVFRFP